MRDYYSELLPVLELGEAHVYHWFEVLDRAVGLAAIHHCGVKITFYPDGDVEMTTTPTVGFGIIEERNIA